MDRREFLKSSALACTVAGLGQLPEESAANVPETSLSVAPEACQALASANDAEFFRAVYRYLQEERRQLTHQLTTWLNTETWPATCRDLTLPRHAELLTTGGDRSVIALNYAVLRRSVESALHLALQFPGQHPVLVPPFPSDSDSNWRQWLFGSGGRIVLDPFSSFPGVPKSAQQLACPGAFGLLIGQLLESLLRRIELQSRQPVEGYLMAPPRLFLPDLRDDPTMPVPYGLWTCVSVLDQPLTPRDGWPAMVIPIENWRTHYPRQLKLVLQPWQQSTLDMYLTLPGAALSTPPNGMEAGVRHCVLRPDLWLQAVNAQPLTEHVQRPVGWQIYSEPAIRGSSADSILVDDCAEPA